MMGVMEATRMLACTNAELDSSTHPAQTDTLLDASKHGWLLVSQS